MVDLSTRTLQGIGMIVIAAVVLAGGLTESLAGIPLLFALAAIVLTAGTYLVGTDVSGQVV